MTSKLTDAAIVEQTVKSLETEVLKLEESYDIAVEMIAERDARICELEAVLESIVKATESQLKINQSVPSQEQDA